MLQVAVPFSQQMQVQRITDKDAHNAASPACVAFTRALGTNHSSSDF